MWSIYLAPNQGLNLYERTAKLEATLTQFMQVSLLNHKSTESTIRNLEREKRDEGVLEDVSNEEGEKNKSDERGDEVLPIKTKIQLAREARKEIPSIPVKDILYRLVPSKKENEQYFARFLDIFNKLKITIPFREALQQMPLYTKFLMDHLTKKGKYINDESIVVEGNCSVVIHRILPQKFKDPGNVTIPCSIRDVSMGKALIDLRASINLMPLSMCWRIRNLKVASTRMTLQLADRSIIIPYGVVEDVLVKVC
ncbi:uncharacterized protein LOC114404984 [Glycine soja]|uniref:uncharacterized protein LOC114404984 n=1 Tax=Glycine soja TaxID=3848 RepID=UPI00103AD097|nr:uncharacterized protein LOC114404984 [Glycine soja]